MSWTDERVATLSKLWADGLSASQIAAELGGVTRNAVIGKVHRLGLSGRAKTTGSSVKRAKRQPKTTSYNTSPRKKSTSGDALTGLNVVSRPNMEDLTAPESKKLDLVDLTEKTCRWPHGDPATDDFHFCGHTADADAPYCEYHSKMAYQPTSERRRVKQATAA